LFLSGKNFANSFIGDGNEATVDAHGYAFGFLVWATLPALWKILAYMRVGLCVARLSPMGSAKAFAG
jgi:hypothetical protein